MQGLQQELTRFDQQHLLGFWDQLSTREQAQLEQQIRCLDFPLLKTLVQGEDEAPDWGELAGRARPPKAIRLDDSQNSISRSDAESCGREALEAGAVAMILVAGGQGSRLGFEHPKGLFPIGPFSGRTLFQVIVDRLRAVGRRYGRSVPLFIMTSPATHEETVGYFESHDRLGLSEEELSIFCQGVMPAVDIETGRVLLSERSSLFLSPDGHGGMLDALEAAGLLEKANAAGIKHLFYGQVDNPLLQICDPALLGYHILSRSEMTTQVVHKVGPTERVGNVVELDGSTQIIEYSDLPETVAEKRNPDSSLYLWAGNLAVHVFDREFLQRMAGRSDALPFHRARKQAAFVDESGSLVRPKNINAVKFEKFIFDLLPAAENAIVVEAAKADAFAPVKNASGAASDTPETARAAMIKQHAEMLIEAGVEVDPGVVVEVNPLWALDSGEIARKMDPGTRISEATYFTP